MACLSSCKKDAHKRVSMTLQEAVSATRTLQTPASCTHHSRTGISFTTTVTRGREQEGKSSHAFHTTAPRAAKQSTQLSRILRTSALSSNRLQAAWRHGDDLAVESMLLFESSHQAQARTSSRLMSPNLCDAEWQAWRSSTHLQVMTVRWLCPCRRRTRCQAIPAPKSCLISSWLPTRRQIGPCGDSLMRRPPLQVSATCWKAHSLRVCVCVCARARARICRCVHVLAHQYSHGECSLQGDATTQRARRGGPSVLCRTVAEFRTNNWSHCGDYMRYCSSKCGQVCCRSFRNSLWHPGSPASLNLAAGVNFASRHHIF